MPGPLEPRGAMTTVNVSMPRVMAQELTRLGAETRAGRAAVVRAAIERGLPLLKTELAELHDDNSEKAKVAADVA